MGIIDTLSAGFRAISQRLWLAIIPVVLDLFLWLGPKLSIQPVVDKMSAMLRMLITNTPMPSGSAEATDIADLMMTTFQETLGSINLFSLLAWGRLGMPSVAGVAIIPKDARWVMQVSEYWQVLVLQLALLALGLLVACIYLGMLADYIRADDVHLGALLRKSPTHWVRLVVIFVPLSFVLIFAVSIGMLLGPLSVFVAVGVLWVMLFISFVPQAVILSGHRPLVALWSSFAIVRLNFWPTVGIVLLSNLITAGLGLIWNQLLLRTTVGTVVAILANAYVGTGLTMALLIFYRDRVAMLRERLEQQRSV